MIYKIAGIFLKLTDFHVNDIAWELFLYNKKQGLIDTEVDIVVKPSSGIYNNLEVYDGWQTGDKLIRMDEDIMLVRGDWRYERIYPLRNRDNLSAFIIQIFYSHAVYKRMIQIHSSLIEFKKKGILFIGPSGIGKTTQAELWSKNRDVIIINGDMNFIQEDGQLFYAWGTPWHGSSSYCVNMKTKLYAIVVLQQAPENSIRELTGFEKVTAVSNSVFYPQWLENGMELCLETLDHLLSSVPVYELSCRPDEESVRLTEEAVFGRL